MGKQSTVQLNGVAVYCTTTGAKNAITMHYNFFFTTAGISTDFHMSDEIHKKSFIKKLLQI